MRTATFFSALAAAGAISLGASAGAQTTIDTASLWNGVDWLESLGEPNTGTIGQTFTVPADNVLESFTFYLENFVNHITFDAYVYAWDGEKATGPALYQSGPHTTAGTTGFQAYTMNTGGIELTPGGEYVAFFSASDYFVGGINWANFGYLWTDVYAGGGLHFLNNGNDFSQVTTTPWQTFVGNGVDDLAFIMHFTPVPEPSAAALLLAGGLLLGRRAPQRANRAVA